MRLRNHVRLRLEQLEDRVVPSLHYVAPTGVDGGSGTSNAPWLTLQYAADHVAAGDTVDVRAGKYTGFNLTTSGTASAEITFHAESGVTVDKPNTWNNIDGINVNFASFVTIDGFQVVGMPRTGIRAVVDTNVTIKNNVVDQNGKWGILTGFSDNLLIENNVASRSVQQHGIYVGNSCDAPVIRNNLVWGNHDSGIHVNGDMNTPGGDNDGLVDGALIEGNTIHDNGTGGGSAINLDGVVNSVIRNNLLYNNHASGISLFQIDGATGSTGNVVANNTIDMASDGRWALNVANGSTGNTVVNNILYNNHPVHGSINISSNSLAGFVSDHNVVMDRFTLNDSSLITLALWKSLTGQDSHSIVATPSALFVNPASNDYHLKAGSPAIDVGTSANAPKIDLDGNPRPSGNGFDIGAYEFQSSSTYSLSKSIVSVSSSSIQSGNTATVTLQVKDGNGVNLTSGGLTVAFGLGNGSGSGTFGAVTDNNNGTYSAVFTGTTAGNNTITATINGQAVTSTAPSITVTPGPFSLAKSTVSASASSIQSGSTATVTLQAKDASGNNLTTGGLTVAFGLGNGSGGGTFSAATDNNNGTYKATFTGTTAGSNTIIATINGQAVTSTAPSITVTPGPFSLAKSTVSISPSTLQTGSTATVTLQAKDASGNNLTSSGLTVGFGLGTGAGGGTFSAVKDNNNGTYSATFSATAIGSNTITATMNGQAVTSKPPTVVVYADQFDVADFQGNGVYRYNAATGWQHLTSADATSLSVDSNGNVIGEFGNLGVYLYKSATGTWLNLTTAVASQVVIAGNGIVAAEFNGNGVYRYENGAWKNLTTADATSIGVDANGDVVGAFGNAGVYRYENAGGWKNLTTARASQVAIAGNGIVAAEFNGNGVYRYEDAGGWKNLTTADATSIGVDANGDVVGAFGNAGVYRYEDSTGWQMITSARATQVAIAGPGIVAADFPSFGVFVYKDGSGWLNVTAADASLLAIDG